MIRHEDGLYLVYANDNKTLIGKFEKEKDAQILERIYKDGKAFNGKAGKQV